MELSKPKKLVFSLNYPLFILVFYAIRCMVFGAQYPDTIVIGILALLIAFRGYMTSHFDMRQKEISEKDFKRNINLEIEELKTKVAGIGFAVKGNPFSGKK